MWPSRDTLAIEWTALAAGLAAADTLVESDRPGIAAARAPELDMYAAEEGNGRGGS